MSRESESPLPALSERDVDSHKGTYGRVLIIAGSRNMPGAACLTTEAVLRSGAGLASLAIPSSALQSVASKLTCNTFLPVAENSSGTLSPEALPTLLAAAGTADVVAIGPGLGQQPDTSLTIRRVVQQIAKPIVLDADGLNAFAGHTTIQHAGPLVITPHPGEMARLAGKTTAQVQSARELTAEEFASRNSCVVLLKGNKTIVTDGASTFLNNSGNPGMATGGSGDVLTGILAALIAQGMSLLDAARLAAYLHGLAGELAAESTGQISLIATDILSALPRACSNYLDR